MTTNDALTVILKQFQATRDIEQAKEDINSILKEEIRHECMRCASIEEEGYHCENENWENEE